MLKRIKHGWVVDVATGEYVRLATEEEWRISAKLVNIGAFGLFQLGPMRVYVAGSVDAYQPA